MEYSKAHQALLKHPTNIQAFQRALHSTGPNPPLLGQEDLWHTREHSLQVPESDPSFMLHVLLSRGAHC